MANGNGDKAQSVFEHNLVKMGVPVLAFILLSVVTWLFTTVQELDEIVQQNIIHIEHLHMAEGKFEKEIEDITKTLTDIRINLGRLTAH